MTADKAAATIVLQGSIAPSGSAYTLTLAARKRSTGATLARVRESAADPSHVLPALGALAAAMRARLGESLSSMSQFNTPIELATTSSLPALQAYAQGKAALRAGDGANASLLFHRALALDPNFAMAYAAVGALEYDQDAAPNHAAGDLARAYARRDKLTQRERYAVTAYYDQLVTGDALQAERDYQLWEQTYPGDAAPFDGDCAIATDLGQLAQAASDCRHAAALSPDPANQNGLVRVELLSAHPAAAAAALAQALRAFPDSPALHESAFDAAWLAAHGGQAFLDQRQLEADLAAGRLDDARRFIQPRDADARAGLLAQLAVADALYGLRARAASDAGTALRLSHRAEPVLDAAALALALAGEAGAADRLNVELEQNFGHNPEVALVDLPARRALVALAHRQPAAAAAMLAPVQPYNDGAWGAGKPAYFLGLALAAGHNNAAAITAFRRSLAAVCLAPAPWRPLARLALARALAAAGDKPAARAAYAALLEAWSHADPTLPAVRQAHLESHRLR